MPPTAVDKPLAYAGPGVRTAPRRTLLRVLGRAFWNGVLAITWSIQVLLLALGYLVLWAGIVTRVVLVAFAAALLFAGRVRWNGPAVRVWFVRSFNRAWLGVSRRFRRRPVPLATPIDPPA